MSRIVIFGGLLSILCSTYSLLSYDEECEPKDHSPPFCEGWLFSWSLKPTIEGENVVGPVMPGDRVQYKALLTNNGWSGQCDIAGPIEVRLSRGIEPLGYIEEEDIYIAQGDPPLILWQENPTFFFVPEDYDRIDIEGYWYAEPQLCLDYSFPPLEWISYWPITCNGDVTRNYYVDTEDIIEVINQWGTDDVFADTNEDGMVDDLDLADVIIEYGSYCLNNGNSQEALIHVLWSSNEPENK